MVLTRPRRFLYCVSKCSFPSLASSSSSRRLWISASVLEPERPGASLLCVFCMLSMLFLSSVTSWRNASRSFATASSRALVSDGGGGDGDNPCCDRDLERPSATADDMLWCCVPLVCVVVGESGCTSSSTSSASWSVACAVEWG
ncbi:hypothetical protein BDU57DRAFT_511098 [Ampelomyces quisqualis]|uniref:Uncharacterized protein n=1 Tax=Ampelomyces quisqualis TaxID=50730 RepID=A0A6A5R4A0_AMPQU|nr:hypothetical protein BDU57DRAFT_511098 [Ampelomyces quisqualis]